MESSLPLSFFLLVMFWVTITPSSLLAWDWGRHRQAGQGQRVGHPGASRAPRRLGDTMAMPLKPWLYGYGNANCFIAPGQVGLRLLAASPPNYLL